MTSCHLASLAHGWQWPLPLCPHRLALRALAAFLLLFAAAIHLVRSLQRARASADLPRHKALWDGTVLYGLELLLCFGIAAAPVVALLTDTSEQTSSPLAAAAAALNALAWLVHILLLAVYPEERHLRHHGPRPGPAKRAPHSIRLVAVLPAFAAALDATAELWAAPANGQLSAVAVFTVLQAALLGIQLLVALVGHFLVPLYFEFLHHDDTRGISVQEADVSDTETSPLLAIRPRSTLDRLRAYASVARTTAAPGLVPPAEDRASPFAQLTLSWMNPLLMYGYVCRVLAPADLLALPRSLATSAVCDRFAHRVATLLARRPDPPRHVLLATFNALYGWRYYPLGLLKLVADLAGFAGPVLLHELVSLVEAESRSDNSPSSGSYTRAYIYATLLCVTSLFGSLCNTQYSFRVSKVQVAVRAAVVSSVFRKSLRKRLGQDEKKSEQGEEGGGEEDASGAKEQPRTDDDAKEDDPATGKFATAGQVLNLMSTDCDRIANFCPSFHAFWSLPFQVAGALYLLYRQVGISFLAGLGFAILAIPLNRWVANSIGKYSSAMMKHKDERIRLMGEILGGIRVVKAYAWEDKFAAKIETVRALELKALKGRKYLDAVCVYLWATTPVLISILTFTTYALLGNELTAAVVFTSMALFSILIGPLNAFPWVLNGMVEAWVSLKRVETYLASVELAPLTESTFVPSPAPPSAGREREGERSMQDHTTALQPLTALPLVKATEETPAPVAPVETGMRLVKSVSATFAWATGHDTNTFRLQLDDFVVKAGELVVLWGPVGSGKSSLLQAVLGEMERLHGNVELHPAVAQGGIGYAAQEAWIQNNTVEENIRCGLPMDRSFYQQVLSATALAEDLDSLPAGDQSELGADGVNLSGGQKARVALARAVYQRKALALVDDPLAALDPRIAEHVFTHCVVGLLRPRGCVLVTHNRSAALRADRVYAVEAGRVVAVDDVAQLLSGGGRDGGGSGAVDLSYGSETTTSTAVESTDTANSPKKLDKPAAADTTADGQLIAEEERSVGVVSLDVYRTYWQAVGSGLAVAVLLSLLLMQGTRNFSDWWLSYWVTAATNDQNATTADTDRYLEIYAAISVGNTFFTLARAFLFAYAGVVAARRVEHQLLHSVLGATAAFFDVTPTGRLLNRFSSDVYGVDDSLPFIMNILFAQAFGLLGTLAITTYSEPYFLLVMFPLGWIYVGIQRYYRQTAREIKRLGSIARSPIYDHFGESLTGAATVRAFRQIRRFERDSCQKMDSNQVASYNELSLSQWLGVRLQVLGVAMLTAIAFLAAAQHHTGTANAGLIGLAISYSLSVTGLLQGLVTAFTETEKEMVAVERAAQYFDAPHEELGGNDALFHTRPNWPEGGEVVFENVHMSYRPHLAPSLNGVTFTLPAGQRLGVVGRTGAGKTSLFQVLLRMVDPSAGVIRIDGVDITTIPRRELRRRVATIPQDPVLFSGTVRENLDPFGKVTDTAIWCALERCMLRETVEALPLGLHSPVEERGRNFSLGQRQLLCLGRALLCKARILCIDEATANVDHATDACIQQTLRTDLADCTVITIAHRIRTIVDSDLVLVMVAGRVAEYGAPDVLLQRSDSLLSGMAAGTEDTTGEAAAASEV